MTRHTRFDVVCGLERMEATVNVINKSRNVAVRHHLVIIVAIDTELTFGVTTHTQALACLRIKCVSKIIVKRVRDVVEVVPFVTILTVIGVMARLTGLITVGQCARPCKVRVSMDKVGRVIYRDEVLRRTMT
ncbi:hypothetical protein ACFLRO_01080, partial [Bacteroidota bacterium]